MQPFVPFSRKLSLTAVALGLAAMSIPFNSAMAFDTDDTVTVTVAAPTPTLTVPTTLKFGTSFFAVSKAATTASAVISPAGTVTNTVGTAGNARLIPIDATGAAAMSYTVTGGAPSTLMSIQIGNTSATPTVTLTGVTTATDATFTLSNWTATASVGTLTTAINATTGIGAVTLDNTGAATLAIGSTLKTDASGKSYSSQDYSGTVRVSLNY
jgi:hypothetical protein